jgi:ABC-type branched-subunit amino acid transport system substrate-binding protein
MPAQNSSLGRRQLLCGAGLAALAHCAPAFAQQSTKPAASSRSIVIAQPVDFSQAQQDVSKDFLIGSRAAWQDVNLRGGVRGRPVQHLTVETDGSPGSVRAAIDSIRDNPACVAISGTAGDHLASQLLNLSQRNGLNIAHAAPWLQNSSAEIDVQTFPIFAARQEQIAYALKTLSVMGLKEVGAVYASAREKSAYQAELERIAVSMQLKLHSYQGAGDLRLLGQQLSPSTPAVLLFVGGTPELAELTQGLEKQARQRYIVALADVNLQTMQQMGKTLNSPVIATQPVPTVNSSFAVVRSYRETLARLFDEPPTALGLAGFIAARYTYEVLKDIEGTLTRPSVLTAFQQRANQDIGGFRVSFDPQRRSSHYVTQSMLTPDGRLIG